MLPSSNAAPPSAGVSVAPAVFAAPGNCTKLSTGATMGPKFWHSSEFCAWKRYTLPPGKVMVTTFEFVESRQYVGIWNGPLNETVSAHAVDRLPLFCNR